MITEKDIEIFSKGMSDAVASFLSSEKKEIDENLFPFWRETIHNVFINHGCPCTGQKSGDCFMDLPKEKQKTILEDSHPLSFVSYIQYFEQGLNRFILENIPSENCWNS